MLTSKNLTYLKLVLVGDPSVGKSALCRAWNQQFAPIDGYHVYHSNNILELEIPDINTPPFSSLPNASLQNQRPVVKASADVSLYIMILQPRQKGHHTKLTPYVMMNTDVVGLCYTTSSVNSLENAVNVWLPLIKYHIPSTPIVLIGYHNDVLEPKTSATVPGEPNKGTPRVLPQLVQKAISQTNAVHALEWSSGMTGEGATFIGPQDVAQVLACHSMHAMAASIESYLENPAQPLFATTSGVTGMPVIPEFLPCVSVNQYGAMVLFKGILSCRLNLGSVEFPLSRLLKYLTIPSLIPRTITFRPS